MEKAQQYPAVRGTAVSHDEAGRRRLRGFGLHLAGYFVVMALLVAANLLTNPEDPWFVWPGIGWGGVLAVHAAFAMGLFGGGNSSGSS